MISFISSLEIINVVIRRAKSQGRPNPNISLCIAASVADATAVNPNGIKTLLANCLSIFLAKGNVVFSHSSKGLPKNPPECSILCNCVFDNFKLADEPFAKGLRSLETC